MIFRQATNPTRQKILLTCLSSIAATCLAQSAFGQETAFELPTIFLESKQKTYFENSNSTATKSSSQDANTPFVVNTTNKTLLKDTNASNLEDVFAYTVGTSRSGYTADAFTVRGFDIDLNNIKVDGMSGLTTRFGSPSIANIEAVEVLKGPASVLYGNMETGGAVNLITKKPEKEFSGSFTTSVESFASDVSEFGDDAGITSTLDITGPLGARDDLFYRLVITGNDIASFRDGISHEEWNVYGSILWEIDDTSRLTLGIEAGEQTGDADYGLAALNNDISTVASIDTVYQNEGDYDNDEGQALSAHYERDFANGQFNFKWRSTWHTDERSLYENNRVNDDDETLRRRLRHQSNRRDWHSFDAYFNQQFSTGSISHDLTYGLAGEYRLTDFDRLIYGGFDEVDFYNPIDSNEVEASEGNRRTTEYYSLGVYAQDKLAITDALTVVGSLRLNRTKIDYSCDRGSCNDDNTALTTDWVGSLGAVYALNDQWSLFGNIAQSFDPYTAERVNVDGDPLDAEESLQLELGAKFQLNNTLSTTFSAFQITKDNVSESLGGGVYETVGQVKSKGVELDFQWQPRDNWQIKAGYAYTDAKGTEGEYSGMTAAHAPRNSAFLFTRYNVPQPVMGGLMGLTLGVSYRDDVKTNINDSSAVTLPSFSLVDVGVHYEKNDWNTSLTISNLLDKTYYYAGSSDTRVYAGDPRKITLSVQRSF